MLLLLDPYIYPRIHFTPTISYLAQDFFRYIRGLCLPRYCCTKFAGGSCDEKKEHVKSTFDMGSSDPR